MQYQSSLLSVFLLVVQVQSQPASPVAAGASVVEALLAEPVAAPVVYPHPTPVTVQEGVTLGEGTLKPGSGNPSKAEVRYCPQSPLIVCSVSLSVDVVNCSGAVMGKCQVLCVLHAAHCLHPQCGV